MKEFKWGWKDLHCRMQLAISCKISPDRKSIVSTKFVKTSISKRKACGHVVDSQSWDYSYKVNKGEEWNDVLPPLLSLAPLPHDYFVLTS